MWRTESHTLPTKEVGRKKKNTEQTLTKLFPLGFASVSLKLECNASAVSAARPPPGAEELGFLRVLFRPRR